MPAKPATRRTHTRTRTVSPTEKRNPREIDTSVLRRVQHILAALAHTPPDDAAHSDIHKIITSLALLCKSIEAAERFNLSLLQSENCDTQHEKSVSDDIADRVAFFAEICAALNIQTPPDVTPEDFAARNFNSKTVMPKDAVPAPSRRRQKKTSPITAAKSSEQPS